VQTRLRGLGKRESIFTCVVGELNALGNCDRYRAMLL
jgi:hypothetical protein